MESLLYVKDFHLPVFVQRNAKMNLMQARDTMHMVWQKFIPIAPLLATLKQNVASIKHLWDLKLTILVFWYAFILYMLEV